jgi:hypothetical protein
VRVDERELDVAEENDVAVRETLLEHALRADARAVRAAEILQEHAAVLHDQLGVLARDGVVEDLERVARLATDGDAGPGDRDRLSSALSRFEAQGVALFHEARKVDRYAGPLGCQGRGPRAPRHALGRRVSYREGRAL